MQQDMSMEIISKKTTDIKPYRNNPRKNDEAVEGVAASIREFGFKVPIVIDKNGIIVAGDTRFKAAKSLKLKEVPCIVADDLSDEQIKAFRLADNKVAEVSEWDFELLESELADIIDIEMMDFGFEMEDFEEEENDNSDDGGYYGDIRERTDTMYNLILTDYVNMTDDFWQMPIIEDDHFVPKDIIGFNYALTSKEKNVGVHFYLDDYQFERTWNYPDKYVEVLRQYECVFSPDFSLYMDMPMPMKLWNVYRSRQMGAFWQSQGIKVIPTISWAEEATFEFCFKGIPKHSTVSISTIGVKRDVEAFNVWSRGVDEMIKQINPDRIIIYGGKVDYDYGNTEVIYFNNKVTERWRDNGR